MFKNINPNFIEAELVVIKRAMEKGLIKKIVESKRKNGNIYYRINGNNSVLVHVKNDRYIIINSWVKHEGRFIDLVNELMKFSFCIKNCGKRRERVVWNVDKYHREHKGINIKQMPIERIIASYLVYGELRALLSKMHLHHKAQTWDNRDSTIMYIAEDDHKHSKRHLSGRYIGSLEGFIGLLKELKNNEEYYRGVKIVA